MASCLDGLCLTVDYEAVASTPGLGEQVATRFAPWRQLAASAVRKAVAGSPLAPLLPAEEIAHAIVAGFLGLELLADLDGDQQPARALFDRARMIAGLLDLTGRALPSRQRTGARP